VALPKVLRVRAGEEVSVAAEVTVSPELERCGLNEDLGLYRWHWSLPPAPLSGWLSLAV
jgi:hypothetical protein